MRYATWLVVLFLTVAIAGCVDSPAAATPALAPPIASEAAAAGAKPAASLIASRPLLICLFKDRSWSANSTATPPVTREDLNAFVDMVKARGGDMGVGEVCSRSFINLTRLHIDEPPARPVAPAASGNPYLQREQVVAFQRELRGYEAAAAVREAAAATAIESFVAAAWPRLSAPANCGASDVAGAVERGLLALGEPTAGWTHEPLKVLGLISDLQHNVGQWRVAIPDGVEVHGINGIGSRGAMANLPNFQLWEGLAGFIRHVRLSK